MPLKLDIIVVGGGMWNKFASSFLICKDVQNSWAGKRERQVYSDLLGADNTRDHNVRAVLDCEL